MLTSMAKRPPAKPAARADGPLFLSEWMEEQKVSDIELAERLGVAPETVWRWQHFPTRLNPLKQAKVCKVLGIWPGALWLHPSSKAMRMIRLILEDEDPPKK
jgi:transcriptional regulator with XRE-family HTH domain